MSAVLGAIARAFSWTFPAANSAVDLVIGALLGQLIRLPFSLVGRRGREAASREGAKEGARDGAKEGIREVLDWQREHPGQPLTIPVLEQIAVASATAAIHFGGRAEVSFEAEVTKGRSGICKGCGKIDVLNAKGYCSQCQQKLPPDGGP